MKLSLYPDWKNGEISKEEFQKLRIQFDAQLGELEATIRHIQAELNETEDGVDSRNAFLTAFTKRRNLQELTRDILVELVESVEVHEGGALTIKLCFADAFEQAAEYIELNQPQATAIS